MKQIVRRRVYITLSILLRLCAHGHDTSTGICPISQNFESIKGHELKIFFHSFCARLQSEQLHHKIPLQFGENPIHMHNSYMHNTEIQFELYTFVTVIVIS